MAASSTLIHWIATYIFCCGVILATVSSDFLITPYLLSLESLITGGSNTGVNLQTSTDANAVSVQPQAIASVAADSQPAVYVEFEPFCSSHPFLFALITHSAMMVVLPFYYILGFVRRALGLPRLRTMRRRLKAGGSKFGVFLARISEQFDDCMVEGRLSSASSLGAFLSISLLTTFWIISQYAWRGSLVYSSVPFGTALQYVYVLFIAPLMVPVLKEKLHGLKLLASVLCFIGTYVYFFPGGTIISDHTFTETLRAIALGLFGALSLSLYLLYYRLLNPDGWMIKVIGLQGLGVFLIGTIIVGILHITGLETFALPSRSADTWIIFYHSIFRLLIFYCINEALRWGEPLAVATALTVIPPAPYLLQSSFGVNAPSLTSSKLMSLILTLTGFGVIALYHISRAISGCTMLSTKNLAYRAGTSSPSERKRLIVGSDYVI